MIPMDLQLFMAHPVKDQVIIAYLVLQIINRLHLLVYYKQSLHDLVRLCRY